MPTCLHSDSPPFFFSLSPVYPSSFVLCLFFTLLNFFCFLYFRSSHSPPGYATRGQARGIFASWNAANWPKINTHVEECYPFSFSLSLLPRFESLYYRRSLAPSVVIDRYRVSETFSFNASLYKSNI